MDKKRITSLRNRITRANRSFSALGDMLLIIEIDAMTSDERKTLQQALLNSKKPLSYSYLDKLVSKEQKVREYFSEELKDVSARDALQALECGEYLWKVKQELGVSEEMLQEVVEDVHAELFEQVQA